MTALVVVSSASVGSRYRRLAAFSGIDAPFCGENHSTSRNRNMQKDDTTLDSFDRKILAHYQYDTRTPAETIGAQVGLSATAVQRRLKRLREQGVIQAEVAVLAPSMLDQGVTCIVGVDLERESAADIDHFKSRMATYAEVQQCYYVTGATDFFLVVLAKSMEAYEAFTRIAFLSDANIRSFTTHVVLDRAKVGLGVRVEEAES
jgi:Lrp/AsnC family leucine-responsive transcriptional regulator